MESVTVSRRLDAPPAAVREVVEDVEPFMAAGGFTDVTVEGARVDIENRLGLATLRLELEIVRNEDGVLLLEQRAGLFDHMMTRYSVSEDGEGSRLSATTEFELGGSLIGKAMDSWVVRRQRVSELESQFDYVEEQVAGTTHERASTEQS